MHPILTNTQQSALVNRLDQFLDAIPFEEIAANIHATTFDQTDGSNIKHVETMLDTYANESRVTLALIAEHLQADQTLLEIGAGLCFTSLFLKSEGYNITALEPAIGGFGMFEQLKNTILEHHHDLNLQVITEPAQHLNMNKHGSFDIIFSNNVMEHIPDWQDALGAMTSILSEQGKMIHACPNYSIPYEPHYGTPVVRYCPDLSRRLFVSANADLSIWHSLNFITCRQIKMYCKEQQLHYHFQESLLYKALKRIDEDPLFKQRHQGMIANIATFIMRSGLGNIIKRIPASMATPMVVEISKKEIVS